METVNIARCILVGVLGLFSMIIILSISSWIIDYQTEKSAMENGYEQTYEGGNRMPIWKKK